MAMYESNGPRLPLWSTKHNDLVPLNGEVLSVSVSRRLLSLSPPGPDSDVGSAQSSRGALPTPGDLPHSCREAQVVLQSLNVILSLVFPIRDTYTNIMIGFGKQKRFKVYKFTKSHSAINVLTFKKAKDYITQKVAYFSSHKDLF